jgi:hypothetical protein
MSLPLSVFTFFPSLFPIPFPYFSKISFSISFLIISFFYFLSSSFFLVSFPSLQYAGALLLFFYFFLHIFSRPLPFALSLPLFFKVPSIIFNTFSSFSIDIIISPIFQLFSRSFPSDIPFHTLLLLYISHNFIYVYPSAL